MDEEILALIIVLSIVCIFLTWIITWSVITSKRDSKEIVLEIKIKKIKAKNNWDKLNAKEQAEACRLLELIKTAQEYEWFFIKEI